MSIFHDLQTITLEIHSAVEVHLMKCLHWNLALAVISGTIFLLMKLKVMLQGPPWVSNFLIFPRRDPGGNNPEYPQYGQGRENTKNGPCEEAATDFPCKISRYQCKESKQKISIETSGPVCWEWSIFNGRILKCKQVSVGSMCSTCLPNIVLQWLCEYRSSPLVASVWELRVFR